jgi:mono/diheme cytochrome c family protein
MIRLLASLVAACALALPAAAQDSGLKKVPAPYTSPTDGREMYQAYCASCHGLDGKGHGAVAPWLKQAPPDLTRLAQAHKGAFPAALVASIIRGEAATASHGAKEMPVWGPVFRSFDGRQDATVQQRVATLTRYLEGIQAR